MLLVALLSAPIFAAERSDLTTRGLALLHGEGVSRDPDRALVFLCAAARDGDAAAAHEIAWLYFQGRDFVRDDALAAGWAAEAERLGERVPTGMRRHLAGVEPGPLACVSTSGNDLPITSRDRARLVASIYELAPQYGLDPALVLEVVRAESGFNPHARSHKGALGLMQLIPATARRFGVRDPFEPTENLKGGMAYLRWLFERFNGDLALTLAGYNAGENAVDRHGGVPPYAETRAYVQRILERYSAATDDTPLT